MKTSALKIIILSAILTLIPTLVFSSNSITSSVSSSANNTNKNTATPVSSTVNDTVKNTTSSVYFTVNDTTNYPRTFVEYLRNSIAHEDGKVIAELAKFGIVILSHRVPAEEIARLKKANPNIKLGYYVSPVSVVNGAWAFPWSFDRDYYNTVSANNWWMHDVDGGIIVTYGERTDKYFNIGVNFTRYCAKDENGERFYEWISRYFYEWIIRRNPDFLFVDEFFAGYAWLSNVNGNGDIDIDNDGEADNARKINAACSEGLRIIFTRLRQLLKDNYRENMVIIINGSHGGPFHDLFNGAEREMYPHMHGGQDAGYNPYGYHWADNMFNQDYGYLANDKLFRSPRFSLVAANPIFDWGSTQTEPPINSYFEDRMRFALASCLLGDGYFGISNWSVVWWLDKYYTFNGKKGYLGRPLGNAFQIIKERRQGERYGVYMRNFTKGLVLVNASGYPQSVNLYKSRYLRVQDGKYGRVLTGTVSIPAWDALILVRESNAIR